MTVFLDFGVGVEGGNFSSGSLGNLSVLKRVLFYTDPVKFFSVFRKNNSLKYALSKKTDICHSEVPYNFMLNTPPK